MTSVSQFFLQGMLEGAGSCWQRRGKPAFAHLPQQEIGIFDEQDLGVTSLFVPQCSFCHAPTHPRQKSDHKEVKIVPISAVWQESYFLHKLIYKYSKSRRAILKNNNWFVKDFPRRSDLPLVDARGSPGGGGPGSDVWVSRREDRGGQAHLPPLDPRRSWAACLRLL